MLTSIYAKLSAKNKEELQNRIDFVISTNTDKCTTDADIRYFETEDFLKEKGLI
jgi:predicted site-specific integrase-resolvase|tara:strand:+ start:424 stop:585 length:162 start_codon:yes stop_codon:yes gene_type:complete